MSKLWIFLLAVAAVVLVVFFTKPPASKKIETKEEIKSVMPENILKTSDGVKIAYDLYEVANAKKWFVLVHMMPATKESWADFTKFAQGRGYASIAIDLRGHGQSEGGPDGYENFSDADHQKSIADIAAAVDYLKTTGATPDKIQFIGASIGANLVLKFIVEHSEFKKATLLSPGFNYKGIETLPLVEKLVAGQGVWFVAAEDDERAGGNAGVMAKQLYEATPSNVERRGTVFEKGGHGTDILKEVKELAAKIVEF